MGGCRCYYRNCKVNSYKSSSMHFFRFPLKDKARCDLWVKYSQYEDLHYLPLGRQKNITICARHFRDECFMNYKKDRLIAKAVPTIHRLSKDKALDYELENNHGVLVTLPDAQKSHLIAPLDFECPLGYEFDAQVSEMLRNLENQRSVEHSEVDGEVTEPSTSNLNLISTTDRVEIVETMEIPSDQGIIKRKASCMVIEETVSDEENGAVKRTKKSNHTEDDSSSIAGDNIVISANSETNNQPTIINHQIMDAEGRLWLQSDTFSIQDDAGYQFVEIQPQSEHTETEDIQEVIEKLDEEENAEEDDLSLNADLLLSHKLEAASIEIDDLHVQLQKEIDNAKKLETKLSASRIACTRSEQLVASLKSDITALQNTNEELESKSMEIQILKMRLEDEKEERTKLENELSACKQECADTKDYMASLKTTIVKAKYENDELKKNVQNSQAFNEKVTKLKKESDKQLQDQHLKHTQIEQQLQQQITTLEQSLELARLQITEANNDLSSLKMECANIKSERLSVAQKLLVIESQLSKLQKQYDNKVEEYTQLETSCESLQKSNEKLKADYKMLESNQNQVSTVTTTNNKSAAVPVVLQQQPTITALTKAQLFNGIKRYISSSMCSLLRMEMFGSSERDWKPDERQVAVDLLRLGEFVYKYLTDEWRFRLPALKDVRNWLNQSVAMDDEEDL